MKKFDLKYVVEKVKTTDYKKLAKDFWYGKPHGERRLGDLYCDKTGLYKHREWRGVKDTFYYFNKVWLYNYGMLVYDVMRYGGVWTFAKGCWRYRWMGQTYLPVLHWFDRGMEGLRGEALRAERVVDALPQVGQRVEERAVKIKDRKLIHGTFSLSTFLPRQRHLEARRTRCPGRDERGADGRRLRSLQPLLRQALRRPDRAV